jgi:hypothetical protein
MDRAEWLERFLKRLTARQPEALQGLIDGAAEEWAPYWEELNPEDAADMAAAGWVRGSLQAPDDLSDRI